MDSSKPGLLRRYFSGVAEFCFQTRLGVVDPPLIDYLSDLLTRFVRYDAIYRVRNLAGRRLGEVAEMMLEAEQRVGDARREIHRQIGDYTLFWSGVYPEAVHRLRSSTKTDQIVDYCVEGKRAYWIASTIATADDDQAACNAVLERLSRQFELCAYGLSEVRRHWEERDSSGPTQPFLIN